MRNFPKKPKDTSILFVGQMPTCVKLKRIPTGNSSPSVLWKQSAAQSKAGTEPWKMGKLTI